jgi:DinB family protein
MQDYVADLLDSLERAEPLLRRLNDTESARRPAPGKWSSREIIGHLVDSASNNHQRFVRAMFQEDLVFTGYAQDDWVSAQRYQDAPWQDLVTLWVSFNRHLARVMAAIPEAVRTRPHQRHNLHVLAFHPWPADKPGTLDYFMRDYVVHLQHHLRQVSAISKAHVSP